MNQQAFNDLYNEFVRTGYKGSPNDFKTLMNTNPNAFNDGYKLFTNTGYNGSKSDFANLIGVNVPEVEVKKKDEGMALPSEDGSLASSETDVISKEEQVVSEAPTQRDKFLGTIISEQPPKAFSEPVVQDGVSVSEQVKYDPFIESVNKVVNKELVSNDLGSVLMPLLSMFTRPDATEENVIPKMQYYFGEYGFEFETADWFGDGMTVKAKNGKQKYINLDRVFFAEKTAEDLKKFLIENREVKEYAASDRKIYDEQQIKDAVEA